MQYNPIALDKMSPLQQLSDKILKNHFLNIFICSFNLNLTFHIFVMICDMRLILWLILLHFQISGYADLAGPDFSFTETRTSNFPFSFSIISNDVFAIVSSQKIHTEKSLFQLLRFNSKLTIVALISIYLLLTIRAFGSARSRLTTIYRYKIPCPLNFKISVKAITNY